MHLNDGAAGAFSRPVAGGAREKICCWNLAMMVDAIIILRDKMNCGVGLVYSEFQRCANPAVYLMSQRSFGIAAFATRRAADAAGCENTTKPFQRPYET